MKHIKVILGLTFTLWLLVPAQANEPQQQVTFASVQALSDVTPDSHIAYGKSTTQFIESWQPALQKPIADIVFIHGGCWLSQYDVTHSRALSAALSLQGYRVWSVEYRRVGDESGNWPHSLNDIVSAVRFLTENQKLIPKQTLLMGHSAGGHLALLAGSKLANEVAGVIGLAAITDIEQYAQGDNSCQRVAEQFMQGTPEEIPEKYQQANPIYQTMHPNTWLVYGGADHIVPAKQAMSLSGVNRIKTDNAGHFDFIHPHSIAWNDVMSALQRAL
ncbi:MAG: alpha/beta hydrolase family protein [Aestuariibacter sp.]